MKLYPLSVAARLIGVQTWTVKQLCSRGILPYQQLQPGTDRLLDRHGMTCLWALTACLRRNVPMETIRPVIRLMSRLTEQEIQAAFDEGRTVVFFDGVTDSPARLVAESEVGELRSRWLFSLTVDLKACREMIAEHLAKQGEKLQEAVE